MNRRHFINFGLTAMIGTPLLAALQRENLETAATILEKATASGTVSTAAMSVFRRDEEYTRVFGKVGDEHPMFLLGSISKPICMTGLMTLYDAGEFRLDDPVKRFLPQFTGEGRDAVTLQHLLTHVSGLPDQLPENNLLRKKHADLKEFASHAMRTPLHFVPGTRYEYSSMAILLAAQIAEQISGESILQLIERTVIQPLGLKHTAQGLGKFDLTDMVSCQTEKAAPESGAGDPTAKDWDWNSPYWRKLGAPWGGTHSSAADVARILAEFLLLQGKVVKPTTATLMVTNRNPEGIQPRGLGFNVGRTAGSKGCSDRTFGHTGSTGTLAWADPESETICVILTSLPARAIQPHPRDVAGEKVVSG